MEPLVNNSVKNVVMRVLQMDYNQERPENTFRSMLSQNNIKSFKKGDTVIYRDDNATHVYILVRGKANIVNVNSLGLDVILDEVEPPEILGLIEVLNNKSRYTAYVIADTSCTFLRISADDFINNVKNDAELCFAMLKYMNQVTVHNMDSREIKSLVQPKDILINYLYNISINANLPFTIKDTREKISSSLHINLRTLHRYVHEFASKNLITLNRGKIMITRENLKRLSEENEVIKL